jgi:hypothetical protein
MRYVGFHSHFLERGGMCEGVRRSSQGIWYRCTAKWVISPEMLCCLCHVERALRKQPPR